MLYDVKLRIEYPKNRKVWEILKEKIIPAFEKWHPINLCIAKIAYYLDENSKYYAHILI